MIRTAILAGLLLVMLSIAYSRMDVTPEAARSAAAVIEEQPRVRAEAPVATPKQRPRAYAEAAPPRSQRRAPVAREQAREEARDVAAPPEPVLPPARHDVQRPQPLSSPVIAQAKSESVASSAPAIQPAAVAAMPQSIVPQNAAAPVVPAQAAPPAAAAQVAADSVPAPSPVGSPALLVPPPAQEAERSAPTKSQDMPVINVAARPVVTPWEASPRSVDQASAAPVNAAPVNAAAVDPAPAKQPAADAPKFMSPAERSRELYKLAREMEDTFINKLSR